MHSQVKMLLVTLGLGPILVWGPSATEALSRMETFRVREVDVRGIRFLTEDSVITRMELGPAASVWGDRAVWRERIEAHPLVLSVEVDRRLPDGLVVTVEERRPVALAAAPVLEPVDAEGIRLPVDPTRHGLDLPIISADRLPPKGASVFPAEVRRLAAEIEHLRRADEELVRRISALSLRDDGSVRLRLVSPDVDLLLWPGTTLGRLREAEAALTDAISRDPGGIPDVVDLRFADQVVVRRNPD